MNNPKRVILHCSATPDFKEGSKLFNSIGAKQIDIWHRLRHFNKIGYHWVIRRDGTVEPGRDMKEIGAHCLGQNQDTLGVCYVGTRRPTEAQLDGMILLQKLIAPHFGITPDDWHPHNEYANKICPGVDINLIRAMLKDPLASAKAQLLGQSIP